MSGHRKTESVVKVSGIGNLGIKERWNRSKPLPSDIRERIDIGLTPSIPQGVCYVLTDVTHLPGCTSKDKAIFVNIYVKLKLYF